MRRAALIPLLIVAILGGAAVANAWTSTFLGPYYGVAGTGPIYFDHSFELSGGGWIFSTVYFNDFNMTSGVFGTVGFYAENGVTLTVNEVVPVDHITVTADATLANSTIKIYTPGIVPINCTGQVSWTSNGLVSTIIVPLGSNTITLTFTSGPSGTRFYIPDWFINLAGDEFGIANFFTSLSSVMTSFVAWFTGSIATIVSLIFTIMTAITYLAGYVIYWFSTIVTFLVQFFNVVKSIWDGTSSVGTALSDIIAMFNISTILDFVPIIGFILYFDAIGPRCKRKGVAFHELIIQDVQAIMYVVGLVWEWSWTVFQFVYSTIMQFVGLVWSLIP